jgi:hypothetical protein
MVSRNHAAEGSRQGKRDGGLGGGGGMKEIA